MLATEASYREVAERAAAVQLPATRVKGKDEPIVLYSIRGVASAGASAGGAVELAIPVTYATGAGQEEAALIAAAQPRPEGGFLLHLLCRQRLPEGDGLTLVPELAELPDLPALSCRVSASSSAEAHETAGLFQASLVLAPPDAELLPLLRAGQTVQSALDTVEGLRESAAQTG